MREIKFRGLDENSKWRYGHYYRTIEKHLICELSLDGEYYNEYIININRSFFFCQAIIT
jgi:hypothetical protein